MMTERAFTFYEVLITLTIVTVLSMVVFPPIQNFLNHSQDKLLQAQLLQAIQFAHQEAVAKGIKIALCGSQDNVVCASNEPKSLLIFTDENNDGIVHHKDQILAIISLPLEGILHWRSYPYYRGYLLFLPSRLMDTNDNAAFWYCQKNHRTPRWAMMLSKTGRTRVHYPNQAGEMKDRQGKPFSCSGL